LIARGDGIREATGMDKVEDDWESICHYPGKSAIQPDGSLAIAASGYTSSSHWSGLVIVKVDDPDYEMWRWVIQFSDRFQGTWTEDLPRVREEFRKTSTHS
jgi:hypothetical protein